LQGKSDPRPGMLICLDEAGSRQVAAVAML
jgi:hypothetical protein